MKWWGNVIRKGLTPQRCIASMSSNLKIRWSWQVQGRFEMPKIAYQGGSRSRFPFTRQFILLQCRQKEEALSFAYVRKRSHKKDIKTIPSTKNNSTTFYRIYIVHTKPKHNLFANISKSYKNLFLLSSLPLPHSLTLSLLFFYILGHRRLLHWWEFPFS